MKLTLGFSPCPNDTFIFDALVNKKIDTEGIDFEAVLEDVQTLNQWAEEGRLDVTKLSFPALFSQAFSFFPYLAQVADLIQAFLLVGKTVLVYNNTQVHLSIQHGIFYFRE